MQERWYPIVPGAAGPHLRDSVWTTPQSAQASPTTFKAPAAGPLPIVTTQKEASAQQTAPMVPLGSHCRIAARVSGARRRVTVGPQQGPSAREVRFEGWEAGRVATWATRIPLCCSAAGALNNRQPAASELCLVQLRVRCDQLCANGRECCLRSCGTGQDFRSAVVSGTVRAVM